MASGGATSSTFVPVPARSGTRATSDAGEPPERWVRPLVAGGRPRGDGGAGSVHDAGQLRRADRRQVAGHDEDRVGARPPRPTRDPPRAPSLSPSPAWATPRGAERGGEREHRPGRARRRPRRPRPASPRPPRPSGRGGAPRAPGAPPRRGPRRGGTSPPSRPRTGTRATMRSRRGRRVGHAAIVDEAALGYRTGRHDDRSARPPRSRRSPSSATRRCCIEIAGTRILTDPLVFERLLHPAPHREPPRPGPPPRPRRGPHLAPPRRPPAHPVAPADRPGDAGDHAGRRRAPPDRTTGSPGSRASGRATA